MITEFIVLIPTHFENAKNVANQFDGAVFGEISNAIKCLSDTLTNDEDEENEEVLVYATQRFSKALNDGDINVNNYFVTNIFIDRN